jgi:hypothetical protein
MFVIYICKRCFRVEYAKVQNTYVTTPILIPKKYKSSKQKLKRKCITHYLCKMYIIKLCIIYIHYIFAAIIGIFMLQRRR